MLRSEKMQQKHAVPAGNSECSKETPRMLKATESMGNTRKSMADSCQCMTKPTTIS